MRAAPIVWPSTIESMAAVPTSALTESDLLRAGLGQRLPRIVQESCVCGGLISAEDYDSDIRAAVAHHSRTEMHRGWRSRNGL